jgi:predicted DsbA family dithiol-disulfide isomerase
VEIRWTAFPLHPEIPAEGVTLEELFAGRRIDIPGMLQRLEHTARGLGLPFGERRMSFNSRRAQEAAKWAETRGQADAFHNAVFRAYFAEGKNLHAVETLAAAAESAGLRGGDLEEALRSNAFKTAVDQDWLRARQLGITAVPTFRMNGDNLVGAQPYEPLAAFLAAQGVPARKPSEPI